VLALTGDDYRPSLGILVVPGVAAIVLLLWLRSRAPRPELFEGNAHPERPEGSEPKPADGFRLPGAFWVYSGFGALTMTGFATFGLISFHIVEQGILPAPWVPVVYAGVMLVDAVVALATGWLYDRIGSAALVVLPPVCAVLPALAFGGAVIAVLIGAVLWGAALGIQESTLRATIADLVPPSHRATAYGLFAAALGIAAALGGALAGWLYSTSLVAFVVTTAAIQALALAVLLAFLIRNRSRRKSAALNA